MNKIKVLLSTFGPLHLIKGAEYLSPYVDIKVIQGWIPSKYDKFLIKFASKLVGRDLSKSFGKRTPEVLKNRNFSCSLGEFYLWTMRVLSKHISIIDKNKISLYASKIYGWQSKKIVKNANIFHVRSGSGFSGAIEKAKDNGMKVIVDHSIAHPAFMDIHLKSEFEKHNTFYDMGMRAPFWKEVLADCIKADRVLVNSFFVKETFVSEGFNPEIIDVVYLGVRNDFWFLKQNWEINGSIKILFTGAFGFRKGAEYLLKALQVLENLNIDYQMTVVGEFYEALPLLEKYPVKNINFVGHVPQIELKDYLANSDVYLFPSLCEGCASSGMEAMAAGLPVISTKESGLPIEHNVDGIIIPSQSVEAIVDALLFMKKNNSSRESIGRNASMKISESYTWENYAENVIKTYRVCLTQ